MMILEVIGTISMVAGTLFVFVAGLGVLRLPDVPMRMHASTKAGTLGVALISLAMVCFFPTLSIFARAGVLVLFLLLTAPVAAHMIARAAYHGGEKINVHLWEGTRVNHMEEGHQVGGDGSPTPPASSDPASQRLS